MTALTKNVEYSDFFDQHISIAMITMNEEKAIVKVIQDIKSVAPGAEIIIVDSSSDDTANIASKLGVKVFRQFPPCGYGPAMALALKKASREIIITLDCDDTYPTLFIPELATCILKQEYDVVNASRLKSKPKNMSWSHYIGNYLFASLASLIYCTKITDLHSGMRAYRKSMLDSIKFETNGAALPVELLLKPMKLGFKVHTIFIDYKERVGQSKMHAFSTSWWTIKRILKVKLFTK